jgi:hypothetical protein
VQQLYILRRFSSWSFRLSVSVALLVGSVGLAASLLVGAAIGSADAQAISWQPTSRLPQPPNELAPTQQPSEQALPESLSSLVPAYSFASSTTVSPPPTSQLYDQPASTDAAFLPTTSSFKSTVQQSWHTFKQAFR